jgi:hypothetical protein
VKKIFNVMLLGNGGADRQLWDQFALSCNLFQYVIHSISEYTVRTKCKI